MCKLQNLSLVLLALLLSGCQFLEPGIPGSGKIQTDDRKVGDFDSVSFSGGGKLKISVGAESPVCQVECDDNLLEFIETKIDNGTLEIRCTKSIAPSQEIVITLATSKLKKVSSSGSCDSVIEGLNEDSLTVNVSGSGDVVCNGSVKKLNLDIAGSGSLEAGELSADQVEISIAGSGEAHVNASDNLKVSIAGSGSVRYHGSPEVTKKVMGSGSVEQASN